MLESKKNNTIFHTKSKAFLHCWGNYIFVVLFLPPFSLRAMTYPSGSAQSGAGICMLVFHIRLPPHPSVSAGSPSLLDFE